MDFPVDKFDELPTELVALLGFWQILLVASHLDSIHVEQKKSPLSALSVVPINSVNKDVHDIFRQGLEQ